jgi:Zn-dependent peptidase ImmA (M78 family)/transcriptional regulator with XRE-family HTH domain
LKEAAIVGEIQKILGDRIRKARIRLSLSQQKLATEAGFSAPQIISQIEKGEREIKAWELVNLARILRVDVSQLLSIEEPRPPAPILWRKNPERDKELIEAEFLRRCEQYALLEKLCEVVTTGDLPKVTMDYAKVNFRDAERLGKEIWEELELGSRPATCLAGVLEERYAVKIWYQNLEEGSAASTKGSFGAAILMNSTEAPWRRNFSFGHELFHLVTWDNIFPQLLAQSPDLWDKTERLANAFASSLLLPSDDVARVFESRIKDDRVVYSDLIEVAREFGVSTEALLYRLLDLGFIEREEVDSLLGAPSFRDLDRSVRVSDWWKPLAIPERFVRLAFTAYQKGRLSRPRLAEYLNTSLVDLTDVLLEYDLDDRKDYQTAVRASRR